MQAASLHVLQVFEPRDGGVPEHVLLLTEGLRKRGHRVSVAAPPDAAPRSALEATGAQYFPVPLTGRLPDPRHDLRAGRALARLLRGERFDLVHAHGQKAGVLARMAARRRRIPSIYTPHSFVYATQMRRPRRSSKLRFRIGRALERWLGRRTAFVVVVAESERKLALADRIATAAQLVVVHPGVARRVESDPDPRLLEFRGEGPLLGFVAGLRDQKGLPYLLDALDLLAEEGRPPRFAIVGNGPLRGEVAERVAAPRLRDSTLLLGFEGDAYRYLDCLDAFVLPSLWEGLPMAVLEAMTSGLPVLATAVDGTPEAVEDGVTGYLVPPADPVALAARMRELAGDGELRARMGEAARRVAGERFGAEPMVESLISVYRAALAGPGAAGD